MVALVLLAGVEAFVVGSGWLWEDFPQTSVGEVYTLEGQLAAQQPRVVVLGNSRIQSGVLADTLAEALGLPHRAAANLALSGGIPFESLVMYRRNRAHMAEADLFVINFDHFHMAWWFAPRPRGSHFSTLSERWRLYGGTMEAVPEMVGYFWGTFAARGHLREVIGIGRRGALAAIRRSVDAVLGKTSPQRPVRKRGQPQPANPSFLADQQTADDIYAEGTFEEQSLDALRRLIALIHEDGGKVVLVHMPLAGPFLEDVKQRHPVHFRQYEQTFHALAAEVDLLVDVGHGDALGLTDADFKDWGHLWPSGATLVTRHLAEAVRQEVAYPEE